MRRLAMGVVFLLAGCDSVIGALGGGATVTGVVKAPQSQQAGLFAGNAYRVNALLPGGDEVALKNAAVQVSTPAGGSLGAGVTSDTSGGYEIKSVPAGTFSLITATVTGSGKTVRLSALVKPGGVSMARDLNTCSTIVAEKLRTLSSDKLAKITQTDVESLETQVSGLIDTADVPSLATADAPRVAFDKVMQKNAGFAQTYAQLTAGTTTAAAF